MKKTEFINAQIEVKKAFETVNTRADAMKLYRVLCVKYHPDNNLDKNGVPFEYVVELFCLMQDYFNDTLRRFSLGKIYTVNQNNKKAKAEKKKAEQRQTILSIKRIISSADEFFTMDGKEQSSVLKGMCGRVAIVLDNKIPTPNKKQITDKHKADAQGNFDGMRSYKFVQFCFNSNKVLKQGALEEASQTAWIKLYENSQKEVYKGISFSALMWISCRQAIFNLYYAEHKHDNYLDKRTSLFDLNAYESKQPIDYETERTAMFETWIETFLHDDTDRVVYEMEKGGYTMTEISVQCGISIKAVSKRLNAIYERMNKDRLLEALNAKIEDLPVRKNASTREIIRVLIMQGIRCGMTYKRIAFHLHCEASDIPKMLHKKA